MENFIGIFINSLWQLLNEMSVYLLFGLIFAGVLKQFIPENFVKKTLGQDRSSTIFKSALLGIPLPLCSCSVLPFASALKKDGASKSAMQTFLIATPITGADSIVATWGIFGGIFTIYRVISSVFISIIAGFLTLILDKEKPLHATFSMQKPEDFSLIKKEVKKVDTTPFYKRVYNYAFMTLLKDIAKPLLIGVVIAALISSILPNSLPSFLANSPILSYLAMLAISLPIYVCATASIPIGISLILAGFSPGAVLIFLTAGPASNMATILVVKKLLGLKSLMIYLASIFTGSLIFGYLLDLYFQQNIKDLVKNMHLHESVGALQMLSTIVLLALCFKVLVGSKKSCCS